VGDVIKERGGIEASSELEGWMNEERRRREEVGSLHIYGVVR